MGSAFSDIFNSLMDCLLRDTTKIMWLFLVLIFHNPSGFVLGPTIRVRAHVIHISRAFFPMEYKRINCSDVMNRMVRARPAIEWPPPREIPTNLLDEFTQHGKMSRKSTMYLAERFSGTMAHTPVWTTEQMAELITQHKRG
jgi:hypothetical protein